MKVIPLFFMNFSFAASTAETDEEGYSPPTPMPVRPRAIVMNQLKATRVSALAAVASCGGWKWGIVSVEFAGMENNSQNAREEARRHRKGSEATYDDTDDDAHRRDDYASLPPSKVAKDACQSKKLGKEQKRRWDWKKAPIETCPRMVPTVRELLRRVDIALL
jgi:hypothetical protein